MGYVEKNLVAGEEVLLRPRYHWIRFAPAATFGLFGIVVAGLGLAAAPAAATDAGPGMRTVLLAGGGVAIALGFLVALRRWFVDSFDEFAVTTFRVIRKGGILERSVRQVPLEKVQDVTVRSTLGGRWLSYGDVEIQTAGSDSTISFPRILHPEELRNILFTSRVRGGADGLGGPAPAAGKASVEARLKEAERLYRTGVITEAEYQEKRKALVAEL
ncbi:MAG TPA: PH domain-containing protein [Thermoanaerobaculia bacterium]|nr:PH domain-containing protein [Thermoanaerobaculia bacterium]